MAVLCMRCATIMHVLVIQETLCSPSELPKSPPGFRWIRQTNASYQDNGRGVAWLVRRSVPLRKLPQRTTDEIVVARVKDLTLISGYNRPKRLNVIKALHAALSRSGGKVVTIGDWNARHAKWDQRAPRNHQAGAMLDRVICSNNMTIVNSTGYTCHRWNGKSNIDLALVSDCLRTSVRGLSDLRGGGSDHTPVGVLVPVTFTSPEDAVREESRETTNWSEHRKELPKALQEWGRIRDSATNVEEAVAWLTATLTKLKRNANTLRCLPGRYGSRPSLLGGRGTWRLFSRNKKRHGI